MNKKKILIVDDETDVLNALSAILETEGYKIITSNNKKEAFKLAKAAIPDLAILDVMMATRHEGFELAKDLLNDPECKSIATLIHTSIEVFTTSEESVREMANEFRQDPNFKELQVILVKDNVSGKAGIDYRTENGKTVWVPVSGFLEKPVVPEKLVQEVKLLLGN
jgi:two-component system alkaline phosphatase synthesis response regulator PhoP